MRWRHDSPPRPSCGHRRSQARAATADEAGAGEQTRLRRLRTLRGRALAAHTNWGRGGAACPRSADRPITRRRCPQRARR